MGPQRKSLAGGLLLGEVERARWLFEYFVGPHPEGFKDMRPERVYERNICRVPAPCDDNPPNPRHVVARIERLPLPVEEHFDPGAEVHGVDDGHANVAEVAVDVARRDVKAAAQRQRQMRIVAADANTFLKGLVGGSRRACLQIVEANVVVHKIANGLNAAPARRVCRTCPRPPGSACPSRNSGCP